MSFIVDLSHKKHAQVMGACIDGKKISKPNQA